ncbi:MAG: transposase [Gammaproteobacteria bacterium]
MPRAERIEYEDAYYHVMNRGRQKQRIFHSEQYFKAFLTGLDEAHTRFGIEIHAYCLLGNHYHLLVKTPRGNLSRCMRHINGLYTQRHNRLKRTDGPLFRGRYKAILIECNAYLAQLTRYIHRNPIEMKRPLVKRLETYSWSSYPAYINKVASPSWLFRDETYALLGNRQRYWGYRAFVESGIEEDLRQFYQQPQQALLLGSDDFKTQVYAGEDNQELVQRIKKRETTLPGIIDIVKEVVFLTGAEESTIYFGKRGGEGQVARWMAMYLCQIVGRYSLKEIAQQFGIHHISGVTHQTRKLKLALEHDRELNKQLKLAIQHLTP